MRLLADDLTGALDTAAEFVPLTGPVPTFWHGSIPDELPATAAVDSGTRECTDRQAVALVGALTPHLAASMIAFKKVDSLLRGPSIAEIAACAAGWDVCILAPAFPYQGRMTRGSRQYSKHRDGNWRCVSADLVEALGSRAVVGMLDAEIRPGINVFDAETDDDLQRIVVMGRRCTQPVLWIGTGGLAQVLAAGLPAPPLPPLPPPILGLFGSDQPVTAAQLAACEPHWITLPDGGTTSAGHVAARLAGSGVALVSFAMAAAMPRDVAASRIADQIEQLTQRLTPPGTLIVAGGETLRSVCRSLGAASLEVQGRIVPGVPRSIVVGGRWNGVTVVSKSGAFGHPRLLRDLILERTT